MYMCYTCTLYSTELQKELQSLQEMITYLTLQLREKEERNVHLTQNIKGSMYNSLLYLLFLIELKSRILEIRDLLKTSHPQLSKQLEEPLDTKLKGSHTSSI